VIDDQENHIQTQDVVVILNKSQSHVIMALKRQYAIRVVYLSNLLIAICAVVLLALGIWMMNDCTFLDELLRNRLYMSTGYTTLISACFIVSLSVFGCLAGYKQIKCLLLTYIVFIFLFFVILIVGGVLAYIFREQVVNTIQAEMIADIRLYDPDNSEDSVTRAWDLTQTKLGCCGFKTEKVDEPWQEWSFNKKLNPGPEFSLVPRSCCITGQECVERNRTVVENVWPGDCMELSLQYVQDKARMIGAAAFAMSCFTVLGMSSTFYLFKSIV